MGFPGGSGIQNLPANAGDADEFTEKRICESLVRYPYLVQLSVVKWAGQQEDVCDP